MMTKNGKGRRDARIQASSVFPQKSWCVCIARPPENITGPGDGQKTKLAPPFQLLRLPCLANAEFAGFAWQLRAWL